MAYSRWGNSTWYTFWLYNNKKYILPTKKNKNEQIFEICDFPSFYINYGSIKLKGIEQTLNDVKEFYSKEHPGRIFDDFINGELKFKDTLYPPKNPTNDEIEELRGYLEKFIKDVDDYFNIWNFIYYEWYLVLLNSIKNKKFWK